MFFKRAIFIDHTLLNSSIKIDSLLHLAVSHILQHIFQHDHGATVEMVNSLAVEDGSSIELQDTIFPIAKFLERVVGEGYFERIFDMVFYFFPERP